MLSFSQVACFFDHQYLWKECIVIFDFLHGDIHLVSETITFDWMCPGTSLLDLPILVTGAFFWSVCMAGLKAVHNERPVSSSRNKTVFHNLILKISNY